MKIRKKEQSVGILGKILNLKNNSKTDTYSANYLNDRLVKVSPTEPETGEEVWIQRSSNLFNKDKMIVDLVAGVSYEILETGIRSTLTSSGTFKAFAIRLDKNLLGKIITLSSIITPSANNTGKLALFYGTTSSPSKVESGIELEKSGSVTISLPATLPDECTDLFLFVYGNVQGTGNIGDYIDYTNLQIEQGTTATIYEPYAPKKIYTKNDNDVYEKFYDETNKEVYSTSEQRIGTWIDGKPLYRKTFEYGELQTGIIAHNIPNVDHIHFGNGTGVVREDGFFGYNYWFNDNDHISFLVNSTNLYFDRVVASGITKVIFVVEYTKTTD